MQSHGKKTADKRNWTCSGVFILLKLWAFLAYCREKKSRIYLQSMHSSNVQSTVQRCLVYREIFNKKRYIIQNSLHSTYASEVLAKMKEEEIPTILQLCGGRFGRQSKVGISQIAAAQATPSCRLPSRTNTIRPTIRYNYYNYFNVLSKADNN